MSEELTTTIGEIVAKDFRTAAIFERHGIDFCCGGRRPVEEACRSAGVDTADVVREIGTLPAATDEADDITTWPAARLVDHILSTHHVYVRTSIPAINRHLAKLVEVHGQRHPELARVAASFERLSAGLGQHMMKEEQILFPYIRDLAATKAGARYMRSPFGTVQNPIRMMEREHREAADELRVIHALTNGFTPPADGCTTYEVTMAELANFERDLHEHVHIENNVLFPKAIAIEGDGER